MACQHTSVQRNPAVSGTVQLHTALSKPIPQRCADISKLLLSSSIKELPPLLPTLIDSIFGFNNQPGWGLHRFNSSHTQDFTAIRQLLAPDGPLFQLLHRLMQDPYSRYEFPLSCMPFPSRASIQEGMVPGFYASRLKQQAGHMMSQGTLVLNAFEFYFFHFAYSMVSPVTRKSAPWSHPSETLYPILLDDYLMYFLPADGKGVLALPVAAAQVRSPVSHLSPAHRNSPGMSHMMSPLTPSRMGYSPGLLNSGMTPGRNTPSQSPPDSTEAEMWRSQTLVQILVEFWLNQHVLAYDKLNYNQQSTENMLPSSDHVRVVRVFIKHLHYFTNSAKPEIQPSQHQTVLVSALDEFKRSVIPLYVQKKLYSFLRHGFERWPLDSQFRLMLETWLSYIQPWRYTDISQKNKERETDPRDRVVDQKWLDFVVENLLFYTVLFKKFIDRMFRVDLSLQKNLLMLFRVSKVFSLPGLMQLIMEVEEMIEDPYSGRSRLGLGVQDVGASYISLVSQASVIHSPSAAINMHMVDLEGTTFVYEPLQSQETLVKMEHLMELITAASVNIKNKQQHISDSQSGGILSFLGFGSFVDYNAQHLGTSGEEELSPAHLRKLEGHLQQTMDNFSRMFSLTAPSGNKSVSWGPCQGLGSVSDQSPDLMDTDDGPKLSPLGRYQLLNGLRKFDIDYQGRPDMQPIRSFENAFLVRLCHHISSYINTNFAEEIKTLFHREDFTGRLACQYFSTSSSPQKSKPGLAPPPKVAQQTEELLKQPRISLRWMASYENFGCLAALYLFSYLWWGWDPVWFMLMLLLLVFMYTCFKALVFSKEKLKAS